MGEDSEQAQPGRTVVIAGRPNVGKSAIFNRLVGQRLAIVHRESGVTRDRLSAEATWAGHRFEAVDTGGIAGVGSRGPEDAIAAGTLHQVEAAARDAAVVLLVTDIQAGLAPLDEQVAAWLRRQNRPVLVAANKADNEASEAASADFLRLGFPVFPISALHNRGFDPLMEAVLERLPTGIAPGEKDALRVTVAGHPNVGKSSFINRLLGDDRLIVSEVPGTTRDSIDVPFRVGHGPHARRYILTDTPGIKRARKVSGSVEHFSLLRAERSIGRAHVVVFVLDGMQGPNAHDRRIAGMIRDQNKGCILLVNKWDLVKRVPQKNYLAALRAALPHLRDVPVVFTSALTGFNIRQSIEAVDYVAGRTRARLSTGLLNRVLAQACAERTPSAVKGRQLRIYYATQVGIQPVRLVLFVNSPALLEPPYKRYLESYLRDTFDLSGVPLVLLARARR